MESHHKESVIAVSDTAPKSRQNGFAEYCGHVYILYINVSAIGMHIVNDRLRARIPNALQYRAKIVHQHTSSELTSLGLLKGRYSRNALNIGHD
jgi:hypothetical protein